MRYEKKVIGRLFAHGMLGLMVAYCCAARAQSPPTERSPSSPGVLTNSIGIKLVRIPAGDFEMGRSGETPVRSVQIPEPFYLGQTEVTNAQWRHLMGAVPSRSKGRPDDLRPVDCVTWQEAVDFCRKLSELPEESRAGRTYRLPTEAEWEYACRAGTKSRLSCGDDPRQLREYAWFSDNSGDRIMDMQDVSNRFPQQYPQHIAANNCRTHPVGGKRPNPWALYDMHGNVEEWCSDWHAERGAGESEDSAESYDGSSGSRPRSKVIRGGCWMWTADQCGSSFRASFDPTARRSFIGFRVAMSAAGGEPSRSGSDSPGGTKGP